MQSKTLILIFVVTFLTFMVAFGAMVVVSKPEMLDRFNLSLGTETGTAPASDSNPDRNSDDRPDGDVESSPEPVEPIILPTVRGLVMSEGKEPVEGAVVHVLEEQVSSSEPDTPTILTTAVTQADGSFEAAIDSESSKFRVIVNADGHARWHKNHVTLPTDKQVDLGEVTMPQGGTLKVYVRDDQGRSVYGAKVTVKDPWNVPETLRRRELASDTQSDGVAVLRGTDFGQYHVTVAKTGYASWTQTMTFDRVNPMDGFAMEAMLHEARSHIEGSVLDAAGNAVTEGEVVARPVRGEEFGIYRAPVQVTGQFKLGPLPRGDYQITVESVGMMQRTPTYATADSVPVRVVVDYGGVLLGVLEAEGELPSNVAIKLTQRDRRGNLVPFQGGYRAKFDPSTLQFQVDGIPPGSFQVRVAADGFAAGRSEEFRMEPGQRREGLVVGLTRGGTLGGRILDVRGQPLPQATITAFEGDTAPPPALASLFAGNSKTAAIAASDGSFELTQLSPGNHVVVIECPGLPARSIGPLRIDDSSGSSLGTFVMGSGSSLTGSLLDTAGEPVPFATLRVECKDSALSLVLVADRSGNFHLRGIPAGHYQLRGFRNEARQTAVPVELGRDQNLRQDVVLH